MGPRYSADGATQTAILHGAKKIAFDQSNVPGTRYNIGGIELIAKEHHVPITFAHREPRRRSTARRPPRRRSRRLGPGGAVVLVFTPPVALADPSGRAEARSREQGDLDLRDAVQHRLPRRTSLGPAWNHKLYVNAEMNDVHDDGGADATLYLKRAQAVRLGRRRRHRLVQPVRVRRRPARRCRRCSRSRATSTPQADGQRRVRGAEGLQDRHALQAVVLARRRSTCPTTRTTRSGRRTATMQIVPGSGCLPIDPVDPEVAAGPRDTRRRTASRRREHSIKSSSGMTIKALIEFDA